MYRSRCQGGCRAIRSWTSARFSASRRTRASPPGSPTRDRHPPPSTPTTASTKAGQLRFIVGCQIGGEDGDVDGGLVSGAVEFASGVVLGDGALDDAGADAQPPGGH